MLLLWEQHAPGETMQIYIDKSLDVGMMGINGKNPTNPFGSAGL